MKANIILEFSNPPSEPDSFDLTKERAFAIYCLSKIENLMGKRAINYLRLLQFGLTKKELDLLWKKHQYPCSLKIVSKTEEYAYIAVTYLLYQGDNAQFALDTAKVNVCRAYAHSQPEYQIAFDQMKKEILGDYAEFMSQT